MAGRTRRRSTARPAAGRACAQRGAAARAQSIGCEGTGVGCARAVPSRGEERVPEGIGSSTQGRLRAQCRAAAGA
eukprot:851969-Prymnesium_polylepis.1